MDYRRPVSQILRCRLGSAVGTCTLLFCSWRFAHPLSQLRRVLLVLSALALCWLMRWTLLFRYERPQLTRNLLATRYGRNGWLAQLFSGTFGLWIALLIIIR